MPRTLSDADLENLRRSLGDDESANTISNADLEKFSRSLGDDESANAISDADLEKFKNLFDQGGMNMGGVVHDELGYMGGGVSYSPRGPIKYSKGGAVKGKKFKGSY
mgnify:CR=1 FL=1